MVSQELQDSLAVIAKPTSPDRSRWCSRAAVPPPTTPSPRPMLASKRRRLTQTGTKTTPKAKLRHDDSQIQFAAIDSSPPALERNHSEMLTERQRAVRERQGMETAVFQKMGSSPRVPSRTDDYVLPTMNLNGSEDQSRHDVDIDNSPSLPSNIIMDTFLGSSPTPNSSRKRSAEVFSDDAPPSSPPIIASQLEASRKQMRAHQEGVSMDQQPHNEEAMYGKDNPDRSMEPLSTVNIPTKAPSRSPTVRDQPKTNLGSDVGLNDKTCVNNAMIGGHDNPDASSLTSLNGDRQESNADTNEQRPSTNDAPTLSTSQDSTSTRAESDEVTAQINHEMALAFTKSSESSTKSGPVRKQPSRKRKSSSSEAPNKRTRSSKASKQETLSQRPPTHDVCDCVLIETSSAANNADRPWSTVKSEQSPSPPNVSAVACPENGQCTDVAKVVSRRAHSSPTARQQPISEDIARESRSPRRPRRLKRKLSDSVAEVSSSPAVNEAASSPAPAEGSPLTWLCGPSGSRYAYLAEPPGSPHVPASQDRLEGAVSTESRTGLLGQDTACPEPTNTDHSSSRAVQTTTPGRPPDAPPDVLPVLPTPTAATVLHGLQEALNQVKQIALQPEEERAMVGLLFESVQAVHEAGRRHVSPTEGGRGGTISHDRH